MNDHQQQILLYKATESLTKLLIPPISYKMHAFLLFISVASVAAFNPLRTVNRKTYLNVAADQVLAANPTVEEWLEVADPALRKVCLAMFRACKEVAYKIRTASCDKMACFNEFGDEQLAIDILANNVIFNNLRQSGACETASSEENPTEDPMGGKGYSVAFDPLDGSSVIDTNFAVGTIWGAWPGSKLTGISGRELKAAGMAVYGPRTTMTIAISNMDYAHEFLLIDDFSANHGQWLKTNEFTTIGEGKLIAPGNLRATQDNAGYAELFNYWCENTYQLRYTGGMVPDVNQLMVKGKGVFVNVASKNTKSKLRVLYEVAPIGYLIEKAGGKTSEGEMSVLDIPITSTEQVSQVAFGSYKEVERFEKYVGKKYM